jgi:sterol desaturase/sphingolipid hydroxylase (fatty acid hydroxylase superfamily)
LDEHLRQADVEREPQWERGMPNTALYFTIGTLIVFVIEWIAGRHRGLYRRDDYLIIGLCAALQTAVSRPFRVLIIGGLLGLLSPQWRGALSGMPLWAGYPLALLTVELAFYWVHRLAHDGQRKPALRWLWKLHRTHHAGRYMNVLLTLRINTFWPFVAPTSWILGVFVFLGQGPAAALTIVTIYGWNLVTHSHFRWDDPIRAHPVAGPVFRALEHVVVSPGIHHTHHGYGEDGKMYRNYAVTLSLVDWLFGTLHIPKGRPARYGIPEPDVHWAEEVFYPLYRGHGTRAPSTAPAE